MGWKIEADFGAGFEDITTSVLAGSLSRRMSLHNQLEPTTSVARFTVAATSTLVANLVTGRADIPVKIEKDEVRWFTGWAQRIAETTVTTRLEGIVIDLYDSSTKLQRKLAADYKKDGADVTTIIEELLTAAGISSMSISTIETEIDAVFFAAGTTTYWDAIADILRCFGYVLYFDASDVARTWYAFPAALVSAHTYETGGAGDVWDALDLSGKKRRFGGVRATYWRHLSKSNAIIFSDATNAGQLNKCNIDLTAYDGVYPPREGDEEVYCEYALVDEAGEALELIAALGVSLDDNTSGEVSLDEFTDYGLKAALKYSGTGLIYQIDILATTAIVKGPTLIKQAVMDDIVEELEGIELPYITDDDLADVVVSGRKAYWEYSAVSYQFVTFAEPALGSVVTLEDASLSISQLCHVVEFEEDDEGRFRVTLEAAEEYELADITTSGSVGASPDAPAIGGEPATQIGADSYIWNHNVPPTNNVTDLVLSSADNPAGGVDVMIEWEYEQGGVPADGFLVYMKRDIAEPGEINLATDTAFPVMAKTNTFALKLTLPTRQKDVTTHPIHYRFGVIAFGFRSSGIVFHEDGVVEDEDWIDKTFACVLETDAYNFWDLATGELRVGDADNYIHVDPVAGTFDIVGLKVRISEDGLSVGTNGYGQDWKPADSTWEAEIAFDAGTSSVVWDFQSSDPGEIYAIYRKTSDSNYIYVTLYNNGEFVTDALVHGTASVPLGVCAVAGTYRGFLKYDSDSYLRGLGGVLIDGNNAVANLVCCKFSDDRVLAVWERTSGVMRYVLIAADGTIGTPGNAPAAIPSGAVKQIFVTRDDKAVILMHDGSALTPRYVEFDLNTLAFSSAVTLGNFDAKWTADKANFFLGGLCTGDNRRVYYGPECYQIGTGSLVAADAFTQASTFTQAGLRGSAWDESNYGQSRVGHVASNVLTIYRSLDPAKFRETGMGFTSYGADESGPFYDLPDGGRLRELPEYGSNANGYYVKHADGRLEQWGKLANASYAITTAAGAIYRTANRVAVTFPVQFASVAYDAKMSIENTAFTTAMEGTQVKTVSGFSSYLVSGPSATQTADVSWHAIGFWK